MTTVSEHDRIRQCERTAARVLDERAVVIVVDSRELHVLNPVGTRIWELADGKRLVGQIVDAILDEFEVEREQALGDARRFIGELMAVGALELVPGGE